jgi:hypothetical protein
MEDHRSTPGIAPLLLRLPREIRDLIYDDILTEETPDQRSYKDPYEHAIRNDLNSQAVSLYHPLPFAALLKIFRIFYHHPVCKRTIISRDDLRLGPPQTVQDLRPEKDTCLGGLARPIRRGPRTCPQIVLIRFRPCRPVSCVCKSVVALH